MGHLWHKIHWPVGKFWQRVSLWLCSGLREMHNSLFLEPFFLCPEGCCWSAPAVCYSPSVPLSCADWWSQGNEARAHLALPKPLRAPPVAHHTRMIPAHLFSSGSFPWAGAGVQPCSCPGVTVPWVWAKGLLSPLQSSVWEHKTSANLTFAFLLVTPRGWQGAWCSGQGDGNWGICWVERAEVACGEEATDCWCMKPLG